MLLSAEQISKNYGVCDLLDRVSLYLNPGDRITGVAKLIEVDVPKAATAETPAEEGTAADPAVPETPATPAVDTDVEPGSGE